MSPRRADYMEVVSYSQAHLRLKNDRGRPDNHMCALCGAQAREWAYMGDCPNQLIDERGIPYSLDQARYEPMCFICHRRHDRALADGRDMSVCPRGHEWNNENTGIRVKRTAGAGIRYCKACHRENTRRWRERNIVTSRI